MGARPIVADRRVVEGGVPVSTYEEVFGEPEPDMASVFARVSKERAVDGLWGRAGLSRRDRRLLTLAVLGSAPNDGALEAHLRGALRAGDLTEAELEEVAVHLAHYAGWPVGARVDAAIRRVVADEPPRAADTPDGAPVDRPAGAEVGASDAGGAVGVVGDGSVPPGRRRPWPPTRVPERRRR